MNHINSVILEGVVHTGICNCLFTIASSRYSKVGEDFVEEKTYIDCLVEGKLFNLAKDKLKQGRGVRVVGYLKEIDGKIGLFAEHIEFKPLEVKEGKYTFKKD